MLNKANRVVQQLDMLVANIPEVDLAVGKMGRAETALDPAPISMYENIINYKPEYAVNEKGHRVRFKIDDNGNYFLNRSSAENEDEKTGSWKLDKDLKWYFNGSDTIIITTNLQGLTSKLIEDNHGQYFRNWRPHIKTSDDIWNEIVRATKIPGVTSAPKLQPIETRLIMLQTGMRAPMGIKVYGPDLKTIEAFGLQLEGILKEVPSVKREAVFAADNSGKTIYPFKHQPRCNYAVWLIH